MRVAVLVLAAGCLRSNLIDCGDSFVCLPTFICIADYTCVTQGQIDACPGMVEGVTCSDMPGTCRSGFCSTNPPLTLTVALSGDGQGSVVSDPPGIDCGTTCSARFAAGTLVRLTPAATGGSSFAGWSGDCSGTQSCAVTITLAGAAVTATFP